MRKFKVGDIVHGVYERQISGDWRVVEVSYNENTRLDFVKISCVDHPKCTCYSHPRELRLTV